jgi:membrane-associated phospholipid phosphatase
MTPIETPTPPAEPPMMPSPWLFFALALVAAIFYATWSFLIFNGEAIQAFDRDCAEYWKNHCEPYQFFWRLMVFFTDLGGVASMTLLVILGVIWQIAVNRPTLAYAWIAIVIGGALINQGIKSVHARKRPGDPDIAVLEKNSSFPSGHSMSSAIGFGMLGYALVLPQRRRPRRIVAVVLLVGIVFAIGLSRFVLRAHWFSDVVGGWALGTAWLFFCLGLLERLGWRAERPNAGAAELDGQAGVAKTEIND